MTVVHTRARRAAIAFAVLFTFALAVLVGPPRQITRGRREITVALVAAHGSTPLLSKARELSPVKLVAARTLDPWFPLGPVLPSATTTEVVGARESFTLVEAPRAPERLRPNPRVTPRSPRAPPHLA